MQQTHLGVVVLSTFVLSAVVALPACGHADRSALEPSATPATPPRIAAADPSDQDGTPAPPECPEPARADAENACFQPGFAGCCAVASIPHEYEMLDANQRGDTASMQAHRARMLELLSHGCDEGDDSSCDWLERQTTPSE